MEVQVEVTLKIKGQEIKLNLEELKEVQHKINTILGDDKEYIPVTIPKVDPNPYPWVNPPIVTYEVLSSTKNTQI